MTGVGRRQLTDGHVTCHFRPEHYGAAGQVSHTDPAPRVRRGGDGYADMVVANADQTQAVPVT